MSEIGRKKNGQIEDGFSGNSSGRKTEVTEVSKKLPVSAQVVARLDALGFDPISHLVELAVHARSEKVRYEATAKLADKVAPSLKSVEIEGNAAAAGYTLNVFYRHEVTEALADPSYKAILTAFPPKSNKKLDNIIDDDS